MVVVVLVVGSWGEVGWDGVYKLKIPLRVVVAASDSFHAYSTYYHRRPSPRHHPQLGEGAARSSWLGNRFYLGLKLGWPYRIGSCVHER